MQDGKRRSDATERRMGDNCVYAEGHSSSEKTEASDREDETEASDREDESIEKKIEESERVSSVKCIFCSFYQQYTDVLFITLS